MSGPRTEKGRSRVPSFAPAKRGGYPLGMALAVVMCGLPSPLLAHDAFGDLGPFYSSFLHPLADPLQAALIVGTAAFLAGRPLTTTQWGLPAFVCAATISVLAAATGTLDAVSTVMVALVTVLVGLASVTPMTWTAKSTSIAIVAITGSILGATPESAASDPVVQTLLGTLTGITVFAVVAWLALDAAGRRLTPLILQIAGSWIAAIGILVGAFSL